MNKYSIGSFIFHLVTFAFLLTAMGTYWISNSSIKFGLFQVNQSGTTTYYRSAIKQTCQTPNQFCNALHRIYAAGSIAALFILIAILSTLPALVSSIISEFSFSTKK